MGIVFVFQFGQGVEPVGQERPVGQAQQGPEVVRIPLSRRPP
jgi:hypothetical protein